MLCCIDAGVPVPELDDDSSETPSRDGSPTPGSDTTGDTSEDQELEWPQLSFVPTVSTQSNHSSPRYDSLQSGYRVHFGTASKPSRWLTSGSDWFCSVFIVLNNDDRTEPTVNWQLGF